MNEKVGRNDPCSCGSGKKYKQCCLKKKQAGLKGKATKWVNKPMPNLMERTFGGSITAAKEEEFQKDEES